MTTDTIEDDVLLAVLIPASLAEWLETWAYHIGTSVDAAAVLSLTAQRERTKDCNMVPLVRR